MAPFALLSPRGGLYSPRWAYCARDHFILKSSFTRVLGFPQSVCVLHVARLAVTRCVSCGNWRQEASSCWFSQTQRVCIRSTRKIRLRRCHRSRAHPHPFELIAIRQLPEHGVNAIANLFQHRTLVSSRLGSMRFAERRLQDDPFFEQACLHVGQTIVPIPSTRPEVLSSVRRAISPSASFAGARNTWIMTPGQPNRRCKRKL